MDDFDAHDLYELGVQMRLRTLLDRPAKPVDLRSFSHVAILVDGQFVAPPAAVKPVPGYKSLVR